MECVLRTSFPGIATLFDGMLLTFIYDKRFILISQSNLALIQPLLWFHVPVLK